MKLTIDKSIKHDLDYYIGKPLRMKYELNDSWEIEIVLNQGWIYSDMLNAVKDSFLEKPRSAKIISIELDKTKMN